MRLVSPFALACALSSVLACNGDDPVDPLDDFINGTLTATADGSNFVSDRRALSLFGQGNVTVDAQHTIAGGYRGITLHVANVTSTGTYTFGGANSNVATFSLTDLAGATMTWTASSDGGSGTVVITELSGTRVAGTFDFTANAASGGATGTKNVVSGIFSIDLSNPTSGG
jgi:hypothetical protein